MSRAKQRAYAGTQTPDLRLARQLALDIYELDRYVQETDRLAQENVRRVNGLYDLISLPWRWPRWFALRREVRAHASEIAHRHKTGQEAFRLYRDRSEGS